MEIRLVADPVKVIVRAQSEFVHLAVAQHLQSDQVAVFRGRLMQSVPDRGEATPILQRDQALKARGALVVLSKAALRQAAHHTIIDRGPRAGSRQFSGVQVQVHAESVRR